MDIVIAGGGYAAIACAARLAHRARTQRTPVRIRLVSPQSSVVERIRLHQAATGQSLHDRRIDTLLRPCGVEVVRGWIEAINPSAQTVTLSDGTELHWNRLVLALGSRTSAHGIPGVAAHTLTLDIGRAHHLLARLRALEPSARVVVVGGGLTGIESASEIAESFPQLHVSLVAHSAVAEGFSPAGREHVIDTLSRRLRVRLHEQTNVRAALPDRLETDLDPIEFDLCVWAGGFAAPALPRVSGLRVNAKGQVLVDPALRCVSHPLMYAAGDVAAPVLPPGQELPMGCKSAMPMGAQVADNLARELRGEPPAPFDYGLLFYCVSLGRRNGLIQWADDAGHLSGRILTGRSAAWFKEVICRSTVWALELEARGLKAVVWKRTGHAPAQLGAQEQASS
jgi:NADH:ubiquinone reductase (H+-translocating)